MICLVQEMQDLHYNILKPVHHNTLFVLLRQQPKTVMFSLLPYKQIILWN